MGLDLGRFREKAGTCLSGSLDLSPGPVMGEGVAKVGIRVFGILEVFDQGGIAVSFHFLEMGSQLQMDVQMAPVGVP